MIYQFEHPLASQPGSQAAGADLESFSPSCSLPRFIKFLLHFKCDCMLNCVSVCVCVWQGGKQGAGLLMGDRGGICVFLARANAHASKQGKPATFVEEWRQQGHITNAEAGNRSSESRGKARQESSRRRRRGKHKQSWHNGKLPMGSN